VRRINIVSSLIIFAISIVGLVWLIPGHVPTRHDAGDLPPNLMPMLSMAIFALAGLLLGISAWRKSGDTLDESQFSEAAETLGFQKRESLNLLVWLGTSAIYWLLLRFVGFEIASGITIAAGMIYGGLRNWWIISVAAIFIPVLIARLFWHILSVSLP